MSTVNEPRPITPLAQWLLRPLGWPIYTVAGLASACGLASDIAPGGYVVAAIICLLLWLVIDVIWVVYILTRLIVALCYQKPLESLSGGWKPWLLIPLIQVILIAVTSLHIPFYTAFFISRPAMQRVAREARKLSPEPQTERAIGMYRTNNIVAMPWGMRFDVEGAGFLSTTGFAYQNPPHKIPNVEETGSNFGRYEYSHIFGNWYRWEYTSDW